MASATHTISTSVFASATYRDTWAGEVAAHLVAFQTKRKGAPVTRYRWRAETGETVGGFRAPFASVGHALRAIAQHQAFSNARAIAIGALAAAVISTTSATADTRPDLSQQFASVCASSFVKSENLQTACASRAMPQALKDGSRFKAIGIGAEINALAANLHFVRQ
ncbi:MAG: hypothetical protein MEQ84_11800 [Mesorhizobium sp.]|nr:hypothetical protein [Mesorhizobium sp.]